MSRFPRDQVAIARNSDLTTDPAMRLFRLSAQEKGVDSGKEPYLIPRCTFTCRELALTLRTSSGLTGAYG